VRGDPSVPRFDERHRAFPVGEVRIEARRQWRRGVEVLERHEERDRRRRLVDEVLEMEELDVAREVAEELEEVGVPGKRVAQRAGFAPVVAADALDGL
jgi:hypothetical protein